MDSWSWSVSYIHSAFPSENAHFSPKSDLLTSDDINEHFVDLWISTRLCMRIVAAFTTLSGLLQYRSKYMSCVFSLFRAWPIQGNKFHSSKNLSLHKYSQIYLCKCRNISPQVSPQEKMYALLRRKVLLVHCAAWDTGQEVDCVKHIQLYIFTLKLLLRMTDGLCLSLYSTSNYSLSANIKKAKLRTMVKQ